MSFNLFLTSQRQLRNGWWVLTFFVVLAAMLIPLLILTRRQGTAVPVMEQAVVVAAATWICQLLRRRPLTEVTGRFGWRWVEQLVLGGLIGTVLMVVPALFLGTFGFVRWRWSDAGPAGLGAGAALFAGVALAEELVFRGFVFQRLLDGLGEWPAQGILGAYFVLTHSAALSAAGGVRYLAATNIFLASLLFGLAFLRTRSLAMPLGMHFAANFTQGTVLGFGVSGSSDGGVLVPVLGRSPKWVTGGAFGLEASVPGLIVVMVAVVALYRWRPAAWKSRTDSLVNGD
jgi:membrane protease YdiL (CAAX protease family)